MSTPITTEPRMYGNYRKPRTYGIGNFGMLSSILVLVACCGAIILNFFVGPAYAVVFALISALGLTTVLIKDRHGVSLLQRTGSKTAHTKAAVKGENLYRSGPLTKYGTCKLPGLLAASTVTEHVDSAGRDFALIQYPNTNQWAVTIKCNPDGSSLQDQFHVDNAVRNWGEYLVFLAHEPNLMQAQVTIQTSPTSGPAVQREVSSQMKPYAPDLAKQFGQQVVQKYQATGTPQIDAWLTLTFSGYHKKGKRTAETMGALLASRLPVLTQKLGNTGAGSAAPVDAQTLVHIVASAYSPEYIKVLTDADARGVARSQMVMKWDNAGPTASEDAYGYYRHDGGVSVSWAKTEIMGEVTETSLVPLLDPSPAIDMKRVVLLYKPLSPDKSATTASTDKRNAKFRVGKTNNPSARAEVEHEAATAVAKDEAKGAALVNFALLVCATVFDFARKDDAESTIDAAAPTARIQHRRLWGAQAASFAQSLPVGIVMSDQVSVPTAIREGL